jgi:hypothetical protein
MLGRYGPVSQCDTARPSVSAPLMRAPRPRIPRQNSIGLDTMKVFNFLLGIIMCWSLGVRERYEARKTIVSTMMGHLRRWGDRLGYDGSGPFLLRRQ